MQNNLLNTRARMKKDKKNVKRWKLFVFHIEMWQKISIFVASLKSIMMITVEEFKQFKAFARQDGAILGLIMSAAFFAFIASLANPSWQFAYLLGTIAVPVFVALRVRNYRDKIVQKRVSFRRAAAYSMQCFGYSSLVIAIVVYIYFQFFDHGMMIANMRRFFDSPEMAQAMKLYGVKKAMFDAQLTLMSSLRPIDVAFTMISNTLFGGLACSLLVAVFSKRNPRKITNY